jgi:hypothetical protein
MYGKRMIWTTTDERIVRNLKRAGVARVYWTKRGHWMCVLKAARPA